MSESNPPRRLGRSAGALFAGFLVVVALSLATDVLLRVLGVLPPLGQRASDAALLVATAYRAIYGIAGSYITARLAPYRPMQHALVGGAIGLVLGIVGAVATWNSGPAYGPHWYPVALVALAMPQSWMGGRLRERQLSALSGVDAGS